MSTTLSNGYKKPSVGDRNWYDDIEENIQRINDHTHDGVDSEVLPITSISKVTQSVLAASWSSQGEGTYKQTLTLPTDYTFNNAQIKFYVDGGTYDGQVVLLSVRKVSATTFDVYINDNTMALKAVYG
jgi:hypothetical protein